MTAAILIADDDQSICTVLAHAMRRRGWRPFIAHDGETLMAWVADGKGDLVVTDVRMPVGGGRSSGLDLLPEIRAARPDLPVIVISAQSTLTTAVRASEGGAFEYLPKPFDLARLMDTAEKALRRYEKSDDSAVRHEIPEESGHFIGSSPAMQDIYRTLARLVRVDLTVTISGESGTGKELVARALHQLGKRRHAPFVAINMAAIPRDLVESELFGYEKGAFTGASARKSGKFEQAQGGTLFLDEIGDMPMEAQTKLLRVLQQGEYTTVGGTRLIKTDARIVCATHRDLADLVESGDFREDLYYRLSVVPIRIPPLRKRKEDIAPLSQYFLRKAVERGLAPKTLGADTLVAMCEYDWPGNVRELENMLYRLCALCAADVIGKEAFLSEMPGSRGAERKTQYDSLEQNVGAHLRHYFAAHENGGLPPPGLYERVMRLVEKPLIQVTLEALGGNQVRAAALLGINRNTLRKKMHELKIMPEGRAHDE